MLTEQGEQAAQQRQTDNGEQVAGGCPLATMDNYKKLVLTFFLPSDILCIVSAHRRCARMRPDKSQTDYAARRSCVVPDEVSSLIAYTYVGLA